VDELKAAPLQPIDARDGGEIVDPKWESRYGHAVAMTRYAVMAKPDPSTPPAPTPEELIRDYTPEPPDVLRLDALRKHLEQVESPTRRRSNVIYE
jgi:hypothetical protein